MEAVRFRPVLEASSAPYPAKINTLTFLVKDAFSLSTLLLIGALLQSLLFAILPAIYATLPVLVTCLYMVLATIIQTIFADKNSYLSDVIHGRVSAQLPEYLTSFGCKPASQPLVIFHMGIRFNHPLGILCPGGAEAATHFQRCIPDLAERAEEFGLLGNSYWRADERASQNTLLAIFYFRSIDGLNAFAHDKLHRKAWDWYRTFSKEHECHIGVYHETFYAAPGSYETIYINMPPILLGETKVKTKGWAGRDEFVRPLVDADVDRLKCQLSRMGLCFEETIPKNLED